jgi:hypothetical protein
VSSALIRAVVLYDGFAAWMTPALVLPSETLCLVGVAWITGGSSVLARDVARWSRGASTGLGLGGGERTLFWVARVGGGIVGALALALVSVRIVR